VDVGTEGCYQVEIYDWLPWQDKKNFLQIYHEFPSTRRFADEYAWTILAIPKQGYQFDHWEVSSIGLFNLESVLPGWIGDLTANPTVLNISFFYETDQEILITAYFELIEECDPVDCVPVDCTPVDCLPVPCEPVYVDVPGDCPVDKDGDGMVEPFDCDDFNSEIHPYAKDTATQDRSCDGLIEVYGNPCPEPEPEYVYATEYVDKLCPDVDCDDGSCFISAIQK